MSKVRQWVRSLHNDPLPVGLLKSFEEAWFAVKEFMETEGKLPSSIEWIRPTTSRPIPSPIPPCSYRANPNDLEIRVPTAGMI
jgi:hypothetical protein